MEQLSLEELIQAFPLDQAYIGCRYNQKAEIFRCPMDQLVDSIVNKIRQVSGSFGYGATYEIYKGSLVIHRFTLVREYPVSPVIVTCNHPILDLVVQELEKYEYRRKGAVGGATKSTR